MAKTNPHTSPVEIDIIHVLSYGRGYGGAPRLHYTSSSSGSNNHIRCSFIFAIFKWPFTQLK